MQSSHMFAAVLTGLAALVVFVVLLVLNLVRKGTTRAALIAALLPLALLPPVLALALAGFQTMQMFSGLAAGTTSMTDLASASREQWLVARLGFGLTAALAAAGMLAGWLRFGPAASDARDLSLRRAAVLCLLPLLGLAPAGLLTRELRLGLGVIEAVMTDVQGTEGQPAPAQLYLESVGLGQRGGGGIAATSERLARALNVSMAGGATAVVMLVGLGLTGLILAWRVRTGVLFTAVSSLLWLALMVSCGLLALGLGGPPIF